MLLSDEEIAQVQWHSPSFIDPFVPKKTYYGALSYGLGTCGYDVRLGEAVGKWYQGSLIDPCQNILPEHIKPIPITEPGYLLGPNMMVLGYTMETITLPANIEGDVRDKSTLIRLGLAVQNTVLEPGWKGQITIEITNHGPHTIVLRTGMPIAQVQFNRISMPQTPYDGRYQNQEGLTVAKRVDQ